MICTWRHSWKLQECKAVHLRSTPRGFQGCETLLRKLFTIFPFKDSHVPGPSPSASARFVVSDLPKCSRPSRLPQCLLFLYLCPVLLSNTSVLGWICTELTQKAGLRSASLCHISMQVQQKDFDSLRQLFLVATAWALLCSLCGPVRMAMRQVLIFQQWTRHSE